MLSLFRINDPYRLVLVFIFLVAFRIPFILDGIPFTKVELHWLMIGDRMSSVNGSMYDSVWTTAAPLANVIYSALYKLFGYNTIGYQILAILVVFHQAIVFNNLLLRNKAYEEYNYVPAFLYALFACFAPTMFILSPEVMGLGFFLMALDNIFRRIDQKTREEMFLFTGNYLGIATLLYLPYFYFFLVSLFSLILFSSAIPRRLLLMTYGFTMILMISALVSYFRGDLIYWWQFYVASWWHAEFDPLVDYKTLLLLGTIPFSVLLISLFKTYSMGRYKVYQVKFQQVFLLTLLGAILNYFFTQWRGPHQLMLFVPVIAFFTGHYLLVLRKKWQAEVITILLFLFVLSNALILHNNWFFVEQIVNDKSLFVDEESIINEAADKKILVLSDDISYYQNARPSTRFIQWGLSEKVFREPTYYRNLGLLNESLESSLPYLIVDHENVMVDVFRRLPLIAEKYTKSAENGYLIYRLK